MHMLNKKQNLIFFPYLGFKINHYGISIRISQCCKQILSLRAPEVNFGNEFC